MKIETKFNIGDTLYYIAIFSNGYGEIIKEVITCELMKILITKSGICYITDDGNLYEDELFATEQEAREYLERSKL